MGEDRDSEGAEHVGTTNGISNTDGGQFSMGKNPGGVDAPNIVLTAGAAL
jgi:hypothetical protein